MSGTPLRGYKSITFREDSYWKLLEIKAKLRARTWDELVDKLYDLVMRHEGS